MESLLIEEKKPIIIGLFRYSLGIDLLPIYHITGLFRSNLGIDFHPIYQYYWFISVQFRY